MTEISKQEALEYAGREEEGMEEESECGKPCNPAHACDECADYWQRMEREGYWGPKGWTDKGWREICK